MQVEYVMTLFRSFCNISVVAVRNVERVSGAFQIAFRAEIHANDIFLFFKSYF